MRKNFVTRLPSPRMRILNECSRRTFSHDGAATNDAFLRHSTGRAHRHNQGRSGDSSCCRYSQYRSPPGALAGQRRGSIASCGETASSETGYSCCRNISVVIAECLPGSSWVGQNQLTQTQLPQPADSLLQGSSSSSTLPASNAARLVREPLLVARNCREIRQEDRREYSPEPFVLRLACFIKTPRVF